MFSTAKKIAANLHGSQHGQLSMAIYQEKCVQEAMSKLIAAKKDASNAWLQYAHSEDSEAARELFLKMHSIDKYWLRVQQQYYDKYECYRENFQVILKGERSVDELTKEVNDYASKIAKVQKQIDSLGSKGKDKKYEALSTEKGKYLSLQFKAQQQLDERRQNHMLFKYKNIKDAVKMMTDAQIQLHEACFEIFQTQRLLLDYFTATTYTSITDSVIQQAKSNGRVLLDDLERKLGFQSPDGAVESASGISATAPSQEILDELADIFGSPQVSREEDATYNPVPEIENDATYNPVPEMDNDFILQPRKSKPSESKVQRPLPKLPPQDDEPIYQLPRSTKVGEPAAVPPVPPRKDLQRKKSGSDNKEDMSAARKKVGDASYLEMGQVKQDEMKYNSVYETGDRSSYFALSDSYSGSRGSSIKSTGSSRGMDSGLESRGSVKSNASHTEAEDIYEILDGKDAIPKRFSKITDENVYEM